MNLSQRYSGFFTFVFAAMLAATSFLISAGVTWATETDLPVLATSYLGGAENDQGNAIAVQADGTVVVAGRFSALPAAGTTRVLLGAAADAQGAILRFTNDGTTLASITRLGNSVDDMVLAPADDGIIAIGPFGLVKLSSDGSTVEWSKTASEIGPLDNPAIYSSGRRVDVAENGDIAILGNQSDGGDGFDGKIHLFDAVGNPVETGNFVIPVEDIGGGTYSETWEDVAINFSRKLIFVTGKAQRCSAYQSSFLLAHSYDSTDFGQLQWQSFTLWCSGAEEENLGADTRGKRVVYQNGFLYFAGKADGGNNRFTRKAPNQEYKTNQDQNVAIDRWNNGAGFGSGAIGYFAKMDPASGTVVNGQFQFSSLGVNNPRSFRINALAVSSTGDVCIGGSSEKDMPLRDSLTLNGVAIGSRVDNENALICVSGDFTTRNQVASWTGTSGAASSALTTIATRGGRTAVLGQTEGEIVTANSVDAQKDAGTDVFFSVWGRTLPTITTTAISEITYSNALSGGNAFLEEGATAIVARGVCWGVNQNPTIADAKTSDGTGTGAFGSSISGLAANTTYFVRAYATNSSGTAYGNQISFTTLAEPTRIINLSGSLAFDNVLVGSTRQRTFTIGNSGNSPLTVASIGYPPGFTGNWSGGTLPASGSRTVTVSFSPAVAQFYGGAATVQSDKTGGTNTLPVSGTGTAVTRVIELSGNLAFGDIDVKTTEQRTFTIANRGNSVLTVESINYPLGFTGNWSGGTILPGGSQSILVTFSPANAQSYGGTISVVSNRTSGANTLAVSGKGVPQFVSYTISGHVRDVGDVGIGGVTLTFGNGGGAAVTNESGFYSRIVDSGWTGLVTPSKTGHSFSPSSRSYSKTSNNWTGQDYGGGVPPTAFRVWIDKNGNGAYDFGEGVSEATVRVNNEQEDRGVTDGQGIIQIPGIENSAKIYAKKLLYTMNHPKALDANFGSRSRNPFFAGTVNGKMYDFVMASDIMAADGNYSDFPGLGNTLLDAAKDAQGNILVQLVHPKIGWNLVVAFEEAQSAAFYEKVVSGFRSYADYMYNFTDGYFVVRNVVLVKGAYLDSAQWNYSDVQIRNVQWPRAHPFGNRHNWPNSRISMGKEWASAEPDGYNWYSTLGHEAGHYLYGFGDEYMNGDYSKGTRESPWTYRKTRDGDPGEPNEFPKNYGVMNYQYASHELSDTTDYFYRSYSPLMNPDLVTHQFMIREGQSCWAFLKSHYENDIRQQMAANGLTGFSNAFFDNLIIPPNLTGSYPGSDRTKRSGPAQMNRDNVRIVEWDFPETNRAGLRAEEVFDATAIVLNTAGNPVADADVWLISSDRKSFQGKSDGNGMVKCGSLSAKKRLEALYEGRKSEIGIDEVRGFYVLTLPPRRTLRTNASTGMVLTAKPSSHDSSMLTIEASGSFLPTEPTTIVAQSGGYSVNVAMNADAANRYSGTAACRHDSGVIEATSGENISISPFEIFSTEFGPVSGYYAPNGELEMKYGPRTFEGSGSFAIVNSSAPAPPNLGMIQVGNVYAFGFSDSITAVKNVILTIRLPENRKGTNPELFGWDSQDQTWVLIEGGFSDLQYFSIPIPSMDYDAYAMFMTPRANDPYPPEPPTEFAASTGISTWSVDLQWRTPDDTDVAAYRIRFANMPITEENWDRSIPLGNIPEPSAPRTIQRFTAEMPDPDTLYYFGLRAIDGAGNVSSLATSSPAISNAADSNGDGMPDAWKISHGLDPFTDCSQRDDDGDGLTNLEEYFQGTEPKNSDTDRDGFSDGDEIAWSTDPINSLSYPDSFDPFPGTLQDVIAGLQILTGQIASQDVSNADADRNGIVEMKDVLINLQSAAGIR